MTRRLAADERALWERVAATVRPLPGRAPPVDLAADPENPPSLAAAPRKSAGPQKARVPAAAPGPAAPVGETLDGQWDRRIASGRLVPDRVVDLHGMGVEQARRALYAAVARADRQGERVLLIITGKGSRPGPAPADLMPGLTLPHAPTRGAIRAQLPRWLGEEGLSARIAAVRRAHPRHGGDGAAYIVLRRRRA